MGITTRASLLDRSTRFDRTPLGALVVLAAVLLQACSPTVAPPSPGVSSAPRLATDARPAGAISGTPANASPPAEPSNLRVAVAPDADLTRLEIEKAIQRTATVLGADHHLVVEVAARAGSEMPGALARALADFYAAKFSERLVDAGIDAGKVHLRSPLPAARPELENDLTPRDALEPEVLLSFSRRMHPSGPKELSPPADSTGAPALATLGGMASPISPDPGEADEVQNLGHAQRIRTIGRFLAEAERFRVELGPAVDLQVLDAYSYLHEAVPSAAVWPPGIDAPADVLMRELERTVFRFAENGAAILRAALGSFPPGSRCLELDLTASVCHDSCILDSSRPGLDLPIIPEFLCTWTASRADVVDWVRMMNHGEIAEEPPIDSAKARPPRARWVKVD